MFDVGNRAGAAQDGVHAANTVGQCGVASRAEAGGGQHRLLSGLQREVENVALMSAIVTSSLNRALAQNRYCDLVDLGRFIPIRPVIISMFDRLADNEGCENCADLALAVRRLCAALNSARTLLRMSAATQLDRALLDQLARRWRQVCETSLSVFETLPPSAEPGDDARHGIDRDRLVEMLTNARSGGWRHIGRDDPAVPQWAQRRRHRRVMLNMRATANYGACSRDILIRDVSPGGFGIDFADHLANGDTVALTLADGRTFEGRAAWVSGQRAGIELNEPIAENDVLFTWEW